MLLNHIWSIKRTLSGIMKVFLGETCNDSKWGNELIPQLKMDYFNPVVLNWNHKAQLNEMRKKDEADFLLIVITPLMDGVYSVAEAVDSSNKSPEKTLLCILEEDNGVKWTKSQYDSLKAFEKLVESNGARVFNCLGEVLDFLNEKYCHIE